MNQAVSDIFAANSLVSPDQADTRIPQQVDAAWMGAALSPSRQQNLSKLTYHTLGVGIIRDYIPIPQQTFLIVKRKTKYERATPRHIVSERSACTKVNYWLLALVIEGIPCIIAYCRYGFEVATAAVKGKSTMSL